MTIFVLNLTNVIKSSITIVAINITTFSNTQDTVCWAILSVVNNGNICSHLTNVTKSSVTIVAINITTFSNTRDTVFREILSLVK